MRYPVTAVDLIGYDLSGTRLQHLWVICTHFKVDTSGDATQESMESAMREMSWSRDDLINSSILQSKSSCSNASNFLRFIPTLDNGRESAVYVDTLCQDVYKNNGFVDFSNITMDGISSSLAPKRLQFLPPGCQLPYECEEKFTVFMWYDREQWHREGINHLVVCIDLKGIDNL
jgi:hypothetical protein